MTRQIPFHKTHVDQIFSIDNTRVTRLFRTMPRQKTRPDVTVAKAIVQYRSVGPRLPEEDISRVMCMLLAGLSPEETALETKVPIRTVYRWRRNVMEYGSVRAPQNKPFGHRPKLNGEDELALLEHLLTACWMHQDEMRIHNVRPCKRPFSNARFRNQY
jgi:hypothetical protein